MQQSARACSAYAQAPIFDRGRKKFVLNGITLESPCSYNTLTYLKNLFELMKLGPTICLAESRGWGCHQASAQAPVYTLLQPTGPSNIITYLIYKIHLNLGLGGFFLTLTLGTTRRGLQTIRDYKEY